MSGPSPTLRTSATVSARSATPPAARTATGRFVALVAMAALLIVATGCAELERPEAYSPAPTPSVEVGESAIAEAPADSESTTEAVEDFVPSTPADYIPTLLVTTDEGVIEAVQGLANPIEALEERDPTAVYDDLVGGLVIDEPGSGVSYLPAQGDPVAIDAANSALLDVGYWDGAPRAFLQLDDRRVDRIQLVDEQAVDTPERVEHLQLPPGERLVDFSASRGIQAVIVQDDACGDLRFYGTNGNELDLTEPPDPECTFPGRPAYGSVAISPDGEGVAYTIVTYRGDGAEAGTDLIVRNLSSSQSFPLRIGESMDRITSLTYDGSRVAYALTTADEATSVFLVDLADPNPRPISLGGSLVTGSVTFARNPILLGS